MYVLKIEISNILLIMYVLKIDNSPSGGQQRILAFANLLYQLFVTPTPPKVLLLDEPDAGVPKG
jgi:ABC-type hemin transport system ATPase subunit